MIAANSQQRSGMTEEESDALFQKLMAMPDAGDAYGHLTNGLRIGRFGGLPIDSNGTRAVVEVLRRRNWQIDYRSFAEAIPHFATEIGLSEARTILQLIGFTTVEKRVRGRHLKSLPTGSFVVDNKGIMHFPEANEKGVASLRNPSQPATNRIWKGHLYRCIVVQDPMQSDNLEGQRPAWIKNTLHRFATENRTILMLTFLSNALVVVASLSVGFIFDKVLPALALDTLIALLIGIGLLLYFDLKLRKLKSDVISYVSGRLEYIISNTLFERLTSFKLEMLTSASISDQMNRLKQFETVRDFYAGPIVAVIFELPFVVLLLAFVFMISPAIGLILLGVSVGYGIVGLILYPRIKRISQKMGKLRGECMRLQEETISQRSQIIDRGLGKIWAARLAPKFAALSTARAEVESVWRILNSIIAVVTPLSIGAVIFTGATRVIAGEMTGGALIACTILSTRLLSPVQQSLVLAVRAPDVSHLFRQIDGMMQIKHTPRSGSASNSDSIRHIKTAPPIGIDSLVLRYPNALMPALKGISLKIDGGSFTCVTGPSGAGKSSLLRAVIGHYQAQNGTILIGPSNIDQINEREKTKLVGYIGHQSLQIHGTISQNLRLTKPEASLEEMRLITQELGICDVIESLDEGFDTRFDFQTRHRFSPAFRTKFAISQMLLKSPQILLLDEPETGLSSEDEELIMQMLRRRAGQVTCLMVSHRPSIARQADRIIVLNNGNLQYFGPPKTPSKEAVR